MKEKSLRLFDAFALVKGVFLGITLVAMTGCVTMSNDDVIVPPTTVQLQDHAWAQVERLITVLDGVDPAKSPGVAALVKDLKAAAAMVNAEPSENDEPVGQKNTVPGNHYQAVDPVALITANPNYWRACLEIDASDSVLPILEVMVMAAAGEIEGAADALEFVRAGPLPPEELDREVAMQRHEIGAWRWGTAEIEALMKRGIPAESRWEPIKRLQAQYPDSAAVALEVLRMRCDLAEVELLPKEGDTHMRDKIVRAEPQAMKVIEAKRPLWAAILRATGEAGDAARRVSEALSPDASGMINLTASDLAKLVADLDRIGLPDWALRALRMEMGARGGIEPADVEAWKELLPRVIGEDAAAKVLAEWKGEAAATVVLYPADADPTGRPEYPIAPVVGGNEERLRREAAVVLAEGAPTPTEERNAWAMIAETERRLGNFQLAKEAVEKLASLGHDPLAIAQTRLSVAISAGDEAEAAAAREVIRSLDRKLRGSHFVMGNGEIMAGNWVAAADAFEAGFKNTNEQVERRAYSALHAYGAARLAGETRTTLAKDAMALVAESKEPQAWVGRLLAAIVGDVSREQLLIEASEGTDYVTIGQTCEAHFALAFAPGQTAEGQRADLEACVKTGMASFVEYEFALSWLRRVAPSEWGGKAGSVGLLSRTEPPALEMARPK